MTTCPQNWVIANWKLNPNYTLAMALLHQVEQQILPQQNQSCHVAIAPPMPYLAHFSTSSRLTMVAQDISTVTGFGAYTGEVSAQLLQSCQVNMVIIGHSERREQFGDNTSKIRQKLTQAIAAKMTVIYCIGESLAEREAGQAQAVVLAQLQDLVDVVKNWSTIIIAYEPIWAIGTGKTASPEDAQAMHAAMRHYLQTHTKYATQIPLLYGGSVKAENAVQLAACPDINGALVGGASLDVNSFVTIVQAFS